jgi:hypothetical protein
VAAHYNDNFGPIELGYKPRLEEATSSMRAAGPSWARLVPIRPLLKPAFSRVRAR